VSTNPPKLEWTCPRLGCKKYILAYTQNGLNLFIEEHLSQHRQEDRERGETVAAIVKFRPPDYDTLRVTAIDIGFLKTRGIAIDDKIVFDPTIIPKLSKNELSQSRWSEILDRAIKLGEQNGNSGIK